MWSSCPCVRRTARILSLLLTRYDMSGITRSTPNISSSGKVIPQSRTTISSPYSNTVRFLPISFMPPRGIIFSFCFFATFSPPFNCGYKSELYPPLISEHQIQILLYHNFFNSQIYFSSKLFYFFTNLLLL